MTDPTNKRLAMLEKLTAAGSADSFAWYALGLEYKKAGDVDRAVATFEKLREQDPDYVPQYLMAGQLLHDAGRLAEAKPWVETGIEVARRKGDGKAGGELEALLALL